MPRPACSSSARCWPVTRWTTLWATKEALRRLRPVPDGDDLVREVYGSDEFRARVRAFLER